MKCGKTSRQPLSLARGTGLTCSYGCQNHTASLQTAGFSSCMILSAGYSAMGSPGFSSAVRAWCKALSSAYQTRAIKVHRRLRLYNLCSFYNIFVTSVCYGSYLFILNMSLLEATMRLLHELQEFSPTSCAHVDERRFSADEVLCGMTDPTLLPA